MTILLGNQRINNAFIWVFIALLIVLNVKPHFMVTLLFHVLQ